MRVLRLTYLQVFVNANMVLYEQKCQPKEIFVWINVIKWWHQLNVKVILTISISALLIQNFNHTEQCKLHDENSYCDSNSTCQCNFGFHMENQCITRQNVHHHLIIMTFIRVIVEIRKWFVKIDSVYVNVNFIIVKMIVNVIQMISL